MPARRRSLAIEQTRPESADVANGGHEGRVFRFPKQCIASVPRREVRERHRFVRLGGFRGDRDAAALPNFPAIAMNLGW